MGPVTRQRLKELIQKQEYEYENPPIAEDDEERILAGLSYIKERNWTVQKASEKSEVPYYRLYRYIFVFSCCTC